MQCFIIHFSLGNNEMMNCPFLVSNDVVKPKTEKEKMKELFPALCRANDPAPKVLGFNKVFVGNSLTAFHSVP